MDLEKLILSRRTVHNYTSENVDFSLVQRALELSLWAPNHKLSYPWAYFSLGSTVRQRLGDLSVELKSSRGELTDIKRKAVHASVTTPAHVILLALKKAEAKQAHEDYATLACSVQIASEFLWSHGVGSKWSTGGWSMHERAYEIVGLSPAEFTLEGALLIGRAAVIPPAPKRPALETVLKKIP